MPDFFSRTRQRYVGVDISPHVIKVVELSRSHGTFRLEAYAMEPLSATPMDDQTLTAPESVVPILIRALNKAAVVTHDAVVAMPDTQVICKNIEADTGLSEDDLELYVRLEAEQYVPYALEDAALDFEVQGTSSSQPERFEVLLVTCRQQALEWYQALLAGAGLKTRVIAVQSHALAQAIDSIARSIPGVPMQSAVAVVEFASHTTLLSVVRQGHVLYSRELFFEQGTLVEEAFNIIAAQHIRRGLGLFAESGIAEAVGLIVLAGTAALNAGLSQWIEVQLGTLTRVANPFSTMSLNPALDPEALLCDAPALLTACGLALRGFD